MPARSENAVHDYRVFGLVLRSTIALPELEAGAAGGEPVVEIVTGTVPPQAGDARHWLAVDDGDAILTVVDVGRFRISGGTRIVVDADPAASDRNVRLYLLGSAMGALLHQRGLLPLHANAIAVDGRAIAFLGHSGAGKSTLAAAFQDRGRSILSDDVCVVTRAADAFIAQPGIPRLRLWRDAVERSGRDASAYERAFDSLDKYTIATDTRNRAEAMPLGAIVLLARQDDDRPARIDRLTGAAAIQALMENTYRGGFIATIGDAQRHFATCLELSRHVPLFRFSRAWDAAKIDQALDQLEAELGRPDVRLRTG